MTEKELDRLIAAGFASEVRVDRVLVPVVVLDRKGRPVYGLTPEDFELKEDAVPQRIDFFHVDVTEKISIAFLLDVSGSMRLLDKLGEAREAIRHFLDTLKPGDVVQVMTFADGAVDTLAPFGTPAAVIRARLDAVQGYGQTALNDAIAAAPGIVDADDPGRKAIVLITDGVDNFSRLKLEDAVRLARGIDVPIYSIGFGGLTEREHPREVEAGSDAAVLKRIAQETGGEFFLIHDPDDLKEAILDVEEDLRSQYVLGYTPSKDACERSFHTIELKVPNDRFKVRTRKGYFAGPC
jgi:Ca-activated chloride channel family protein